jgi:hypothetical protein
VNGEGEGESVVVGVGLEENKDIKKVQKDNELS